MVFHKALCKVFYRVYIGRYSIRCFKLYTMGYRVFNKVYKVYRGIL